MKYLAGFLYLFLAFTASAQNKESFQRKVFISGSDSMPYRILFPENYQPSKKYSLIVFLHGSGERGNDNEKQLVHGSALFLADSNRRSFPAIVVFPQCSSESYWSNTFTKNGSRYFSVDSPATSAMQTLVGLIDHLRGEYNITKKQLYIGGLSMGGMGVFEIVARRPDLFAAAFAICGGGDKNAAAKMTKPAWWIFHGDKDDVVLPSHSIQMSKALKDAGARVKFSLYEGVNHGSWNNAFAEPELLAWLFKQKK